MEQINEISDFFPTQIDDPELKKYIDHHFKHLQECYEKELFASTLPHLHILYMVFVYFQLLRISQEKYQEFKLCWIGFPREEQDFLKKPTHPFSFSKIKETTIFRFFRLLDFDDSLVGKISAPVKNRNELLHANGKIFVGEVKTFEAKVGEYLNLMEEIVMKQETFLNNIYYDIMKEQNLEDMEITENEILLYLGTFSTYELKFLAKIKTDNVAKFISESY